MAPRESTYVFGPVPSRRLGRSLGVDIVPFKTCCYDCIYCQLGRTSKTTVTRRKHVPIKTVLAEVSAKLAAGTKADYLTVTGSGEPTLHREIGVLLRELKALSPFPVAVLTNGALLGLSEVRESLRNADLVLPSLDAGDPALFLHVNRPDPRLTFDGVVNGLKAFRADFPNQLWLEVLLLDGLTSDVSEVERIASLTLQIAPDRVQLNTVARPPAEGLARPVPREVLDRLVRLFDAPTDVVAPGNNATEPFEPPSEIQEQMLALLRRRPCTLEDLSVAIGVNPSAAAKALHRLSENGAVRVSLLEERQYYFAATGGAS